MDTWSLCVTYSKKRWWGSQKRSIINLQISFCNPNHLRDIYLPQHQRSPKTFVANYLMPTPSRQALDVNYSWVKRQLCARQLKIVFLFFSSHVAHKTVSKRDVLLYITVPSISEIAAYWGTTVNHVHAAVLQSRTYAHLWLYPDVWPLSFTIIIASFCGVLYRKDNFMIQ